MGLFIYSLVFCAIFFALYQYSMIQNCFSGIRIGTIKNKHLTVGILIALAIYVFIRAFAFNTGTDYLLYYQYYISEVNGGTFWWAEDREVGFRFLVRLLASVSDAPQLFFFFSALIGMGSIILVSTKYSKASPFIVLSWILFMFNQSNNLYRQYLAFSTLLFAYYFFLCKKNKVFILLCIIACLFHKSALIAICVLSGIYLLRKIQINKWIFIALILFTTIGADMVFNTVLAQLGSYIDLIMDNLGKSYYADTMEDSVFDKGQMTYVIMMSDIIIVWYSDKVLKCNDNYRFLYYVMALSFILDPISRQEILMRMRFYTLNFMVIAYGLNLYLNRRIIFRKPLLTMAIAFHFAYYYIYINSNLFTYNPLILQF